jgi:hypothetical protein
MAMSANRAQSPSFDESVPSQDGLLYRAIQELRETLIQINEVIEEGLTHKLRPVLTQEDSPTDPGLAPSKPLHSSAPLYSEFADLHERAVGIHLKLNQLRDDIIL